MPIKEFLSGVLLCALGVAVIIGARGFPEMADSVYGPALFPTIIGAALATGGAVLALRTLGSAWRYRRQEPQESLTLLIKQWLRGGLPVWLVLLYVFAAERLGALITLGLVLLIMLAASGVKAKVYLPLTGIATVAIWYVFSRLLGVSLPIGVLGV